MHLYIRYVINYIWQRKAHEIEKYSHSDWCDFFDSLDRKFEKRFNVQKDEKYTY